MRLIRIDHVSLNVSDRARTIAFYEEVLGLRAGTAGPPDQPVFVGEPEARFGLFADRGVGLRHVALATDAAGMGEVRERLGHLGITGRFESHRDHDSLYVPDPDGFTVEVMLPTG